MSGIFLIQTDGKLVEMKEERYKSEDVFQGILANYPNLLAGDQIDGQEPRRWLLIKREAPVPAQENGGGQWSLDHLFVERATQANQLSIRYFCDLKPELLNVEFLKADAHWSLATGDFQR